MIPRQAPNASTTIQSDRERPRSTGRATATSTTALVTSRNHTMEVGEISSKRPLVMPAPTAPTGCRSAPARRGRPAGARSPGWSPGQSRRLGTCPLLRGCSSTACGARSLALGSAPRMRSERRACFRATDRSARDHTGSTGPHRPAPGVPAAKGGSFAAASVRPEPRCRSPGGSIARCSRCRCWAVPLAVRRPWCAGCVPRSGRRDAARHLPRHLRQARREGDGRSGSSRCPSPSAAGPLRR